MNNDPGYPGHIITKPSPDTKDDVLRAIYEDHLDNALNDYMAWHGVINTLEKISELLGVPSYQTPIIQAVEKLKAISGATDPKPINFQKTE